MSSSSDLSIPLSAATVDVQIINAGHVQIAASLFIDPIIPGHEILSAPCHVFFIENKNKKQRVLFDLGIRKDYENAPPSLVEFSKQVGVKVSVEKDVAEQLKEGGVDLESVNAIIWSHTHFDHTGDPSTFPFSTDLVVGPGTKKEFLPPYPENPNAVVSEEYFKGRKLTEISFENSTLKIGGFEALDYFDDGSFYLLNVPGHLQGHIAGLARVTPTTFIFMGGDTCHHPGQFRPSASLTKVIPCPGSLLTAAISKSHFGNVTDPAIRKEPYLNIPPEGAPSVYVDPKVSNVSIGKLSDHFDTHPDVFVLIAHDSSLGGVLETFPARANEWKEKGWKTRGTWAFLEEGNPAYRFNVKSAAN